MGNNRTEVSFGGVSFTSLLQILFIGLKLTGNVNWSWLWVLAPTWITILFVLLVIVIALLF